MGRMEEMGKDLFPTFLTFLILLILLPSAL